MPSTSSIANIRTSLEKKGLQSPTRYSVQFLNIPGGADSPHDDDFYIHSIAIPGRELLHHVDEMWGPPRMVPIKRTFNSAIVINFIVERYWDMRKFFEDWMDQCVNPISNYRGNYMQTHQTRMVISALDKSTDEPVMAMTVKEPYPHTIMPLNMGQDMISAFTTFQVSFAYREYIIT
ncbi:hypothetical protein CL614_04635 [archaeon]|nr:hypothetical protein [archaeon]|tara:strand:+ start:405 stop:935 length:531 start_codon:yes stop_codon:yes gene_type:complete